MKDFLFPAVDIRGGKAVRLVQGDPNRSKTFYENPVEAAKHWASFGFTHLHVVDLDGAFSGHGANHALLPEIVRATGMKVEVGGGIRSMEAARRVLDAGAWRCIVGTLALEQPTLLKDMVKTFGEGIAVGVDAKDGHVAGHGWLNTSGQNDLDFVKWLGDIGVDTIIYTDISRDGMLTEPNFDRLQEVADLDAVNVIASGGVATAEHLSSLTMLHPRIKGAIVGMALYEGRIDPASLAGV